MTISETPADGFMRLRIPFAGFYCSVHDAAFDHALEMINTNDRGDVEEQLESSNIDWAQVRLAYVQDYIASASDAFEIPMTYAGMYSPRFYNFETDALFVDIETDVVKNLHGSIMKDHGPEFTAHIEERLRRVSGFIPYYSNDLADWGDFETWEMAQVSTLLDFHAGLLEFDESSIADDLHEKIDNAIWGAVIDEKLVKDFASDNSSLSM